jgi:exodeoxyribonuclease III
MSFSVLCLNIANPSVTRAERQLMWLSARPEHVLVLSETGGGPGTCLIIDRLTAAGWHVHAGPVEGRERGVLVASRLRATSTPDVVDYLPGRAVRIELGALAIIGLYVPSRDESTEKTERKRRFCTALSQFLAERPPGDAILVGDLNVLEPVHRPHHGEFQAWEYRLYDEVVIRGFVDAYRMHHASESGHSWFDYENRGYRFDHAFVTESLAGGVLQCDYEHEPRVTGLSDHAALVLELTQPLSVEALDVARSLSGEPESLF